VTALKKTLYEVLNLNQHGFPMGIELARVTVFVFYTWFSHRQVYTTMGIELARVTVVGADEEPVYESFVLPDNKIIDLNTRFAINIEKVFLL